MGLFPFVLLLLFLVHLWMCLEILVEEDRLVNLPNLFLGVLRPFYLTSGQRIFSVCIPRDRWDKEFFKLQSG